jgi:hypothetical protein
LLELHWVSKHSRTPAMVIERNGTNLDGGGKENTRMNLAVVVMKMKSLAAVEILGTNEIPSISVAEIPKNADVRTNLEFHRMSPSMQAEISSGKTEIPNVKTATRNAPVIIAPKPLLLSTAMQLKLDHPRLRRSLLGAQEKLLVPQLSTLRILWI